MLVQHFIKRFSKRGKGCAGITWRAWNALSAYAFPGNVRELMHTIQHAALLAQGGKIDLEHLPTVRARRARRPADSAAQMAGRSATRSRSSSATI